MNNLPDRGDVSFARVRFFKFCLPTAFRRASFLFPEHGCYPDDKQNNNHYCNNTNNSTCFKYAANNRATA